MSTAMKVALSSVAIALATLVALPQGAQAWHTDQGGEAVCSASNTVVLEWSFTNTEPNKPKWAMDVVARDTVSGKQSPKVTVNPGETKTGTIDTGLDNIGAGTIVFDLTWTDGASGVDSRKVHYDATDCRVTEICRDGEVITVRVGDVRDTDGPVEECQPKEIEVCRDGEIVRISQNEMRDTDGDPQNCEPKEEKKEVCRDGEIVEINVSEMKDTDGDVADCEEEEMPEVLPNTGPAAAFAGLLGAGAIGMSVRSWLTSRTALRNKLLGKN